MTQPHKRFLILIGVLIAILLSRSLLYMLSMNHLEDKPRNFWQALQWAAGTTSTDAALWRSSVEKNCWSSLGRNS